MINLIPKEEKKKMIRDFYYRLGVLVLMMLDFCLIVFMLSILPSFFYSSISDVLVNSDLAAQKNEPVPVLGEQALTAIKDIKGKIAVIENAEKNKFLISEKVFKPILANKRPDIKINEISYDNDPAGGRKIKITGTAPSREVLLLFREALEQSPSFKSIDLPISNFIKGSNIQFSLSLIPA